jgi:hypothetical protein
MTDSCPSCAELRARITQLEQEKAAMVACLREADRLYSAYGLVAGRIPGEFAPAGMWIGTVREALRASRAPRVSSPEPQEDR